MSGATSILEGLTDRVIVGVDGSAGSRLALDWAVGKEDMLGPIVPVSAYHMDTPVDGVGTMAIYDGMIDALRGDAEAHLERVEADHPHLSGRGRVLQGRAGPTLVAAAAGQRLLVVGSRGRSALVETLLGSVASYCVKHATGPVAVIPDGTPTDGPLDHLVVGVDGSPNADAALAWAARHVTPGGRITAVACRPPAPYALELVPPPPLPFSELRGVAEQSVARAIGRDRAGGSGSAVAVDTEDDLAVEVEIELVDGDPRMSLRERAADADLLVVGARGHRGAAYLLIGSVATSLVHHPTVPTVVVPGP